jgi:hypothetical protein
MDGVDQRFAATIESALGETALHIEYRVEVAGFRHLPAKIAQFFGESSRQRPCRSHYRCIAAA